MTDFFNQDMAASYDERNSKLAAIADSMHFLVRLVLADLPTHARILCVGVGTGAEILSLAKARPEWTFVGVDPSAEMLDVCHDRLERDGVLARCELIQGYVHAAPEGAAFDAALSILVAHFIGREQRRAFYRDIRERLNPGGYFVSTEMCFDLDAVEFPAMLKNWEQVQALMGATPDSLRKLPVTLRNVLCILSPDETATLLRECGFGLPVQFFQALMIRGWYAENVRDFASNVR